MNKEETLKYLHLYFLNVKYGDVENEWKFVHNENQYKLKELDGILHLICNQHHIFSTINIEDIVDYVLV